MDNFSRYAPCGACCLAVLYLAIAATPPDDGEKEMHVQEFAALPIVSNGRIKPIDTYARTQMQVISSRTSYEDAAEHSQPAVRWLLDSMARGLTKIYQAKAKAEARAQVKLPESVRIESPELQKFLGIGPAPNNVYATEKIRPKLPDLSPHIRRLMEETAHQRSPFDDAIIDLLTQLEPDAPVADFPGRAKMLAENKKRAVEKAPIFRIENDQVRSMLELPNRRGLRYSENEIRNSRGARSILETAKRAMSQNEKQRDLVGVKVLELFRHLQVADEVEALGGDDLDAIKKSRGLGNVLFMVPPPPGGSEQDWRLLGESIQDAARLGRESDPDTRNLESVIGSYAQGDVSGFNNAVAKYRATIDERMPHEASLCRLELWFNNFAPFYQCTALYVLVFLLVCLSWTCWPEALLRSAFWLAVLTLAVHSAALLVRMYLQGRPPVTNLYSSAVFIGWGGVLLCLVLERLFHNGMSLVVATSLGFTTLVIAHHLGGSGDTMEMMQAVLDTNFWLATHVTCVTIGYTATFVAGFFGIIYVVRGLLTNTLDKGAAKTLGKMIYGVVCFAMLFSFVGTVLGGIWADQSWGRFWGWDPKENGALLIVIMNAMILHARWGGMIKERGMALLAIVGNMVTAWSWFGTNQLGVGLHAYGFNNTLATGCSVFWVSQMVLIGAGLIPLKHWRSFREVTSAPSPVTLPSAEALGPAPTATVTAPTTAVTSPTPARETDKVKAGNGARKRRNK